MEFASRWPDMRAWAIERLRSAFPGVKVSAERDEDLADQIVVQAVPGQLETTVSRTYLITVECWAESKVDAFDRCALAVYTLESSPRTGPFVRPLGSAGPNEQRDDDGTYYFDATANITAQRVA